MEMILVRVLLVLASLTAIHESIPVFNASITSKFLALGLVLLLILILVIPKDGGDGYIHLELWTVYSGYILLVMIFHGYYYIYVQQQEVLLLAKANASKTSTNIDDNVLKQDTFMYLPEGLIKLALKSQEELKLNLRMDLNSDGQEWKLQVDKPDIKIWNSNLNRSSDKRWKVETDIYGTFDTIYRELFDYDYRIAPKGWDTALLSGKVYKIFQVPSSYSSSFGEGVMHAAIVVYATAPAGGGVIKSREMTDLAILRRFKVDSMMEEGLEYSFCAILNREDFKHILPPTVSDSVGITHSGCGIILKPLEDIVPCRKWRYTIISAISLGLWIPSSIVNSATTQALESATLDMKQHLKKFE